jgi:hypothetical protein
VCPYKSLFFATEPVILLSLPLSSGVSFWGGGGWGFFQNHSFVLCYACRWYISRRAIHIVGKTVLFFYLISTGQLQPHKPLLELNWSLFKLSWILAFWITGLSLAIWLDLLGNVSEGMICYKRWCSILVTRQFFAFSWLAGPFLGFWKRITSSKKSLIHMNFCLFP